MKTYAFIFARGGSKGVPNKNIKNMCGKPLIAYSIEMAKSIKDIKKIFVSTEDKNIALIAKEYGAEIIPRPIDLAKDNSPEFDSWKHAIKWLKDLGDDFDVFISLPTTSPLRSKSDINQCLVSLDEKTDIVLGITEASRNPFFNIVKKNQKGFIEILIKSNNNFSRRQDAPSVFDITTVSYVCRPEFIINSDAIFDGKVKGVQIPADRALDIDTELDWKFVEFMMEKND